MLSLPRHAVAKLIVLLFLAGCSLRSNQLAYHQNQRWKSSALTTRQQSGQTSNEAKMLLDLSAPEWATEIERGPDWLFIRLSPPPADSVMDEAPLARMISRAMLLLCA